MKVCVTGGGGFVGKHVCRALTDAGHDVRDYGHVDGGWMFSSSDVDCVVHLAAVVGGIGFNRDNAWMCIGRNAELALSVVEACVVFGTKLVALGSVCAYPKYCPTPFREDDLWNGYPEETNAPYGVAKRLLLEMCKASRVPFTYLLPANMYGPGDHYEPERSHVIPAIIKKVQDAIDSGADHVMLWGDGRPTREFLYVEDCARAIVAAVERQPTMCPVNVGTGVERTILEVTSRICYMMEFDGHMLFDGKSPNGQPRRTLDCSRAQQLLGWSASTPFEDGLRKTIEDYRCRAR